MMDSLKYHRDMLYITLAACMYIGFVLFVIYIAILSR